MEISRIVAIWTLACVVTIVILSGFAVLSGPAFTHARAVAVSKHALLNGDLDVTGQTINGNYTEPGDNFTECSMLLMQIERPVGVFLQAIDTHLPDGVFLQAIDTHLRQTDNHPCDILKKTLVDASDAPALSYFHYPYGARHLEAFVLSLMSFGKARKLYYALSYGSLGLLFAAMLWRDARTALMLAPIPAMLALSFSLHLFGGNLAHAPGFFVCWLMLAIFVAAKPWLRSTQRRAAFIAAIGVLTIYFDLLNGVIPTILALTIVLNHFFYVRDYSGKPGYFSKAMLNGGVIVVSFLAAFFIINVSRLFLLSELGIDTSEYIHGLLFRTGDHVESIRVTFLTTLGWLLNVRSQLAPGGVRLGNVTIIAGIFSWIGATVVLAARYRVDIGIDIVVLASAAIGVLAWYKLFPQHTHIHMWFMVRLLALPVVFGMTALAVACFGSSSLNREIADKIAG
jgi:hypothetical protein